MTLLNEPARAYTLLPLALPACRAQAWRARTTRPAFLSCKSRGDCCIDRAVLADAVPVLYLQHLSLLLSIDWLARFHLFDEGRGPARLPKPCKMELHWQRSKLDAGLLFYDDDDDDRLLHCLHCWPCFSEVKLTGERGAEWPARTRVGE